MFVFNNLRFTFLYRAIMSSREIKCRSTKIVAVKQYLLTQLSELKLAVATTVTNRILIMSVVSMWRCFTVIKLIWLIRNLFIPSLSFLLRYLLCERDGRWWCHALRRPDAAMSGGIRRLQLKFKMAWYFILRLF